MSAFYNCLDFVLSLEENVLKNHSALWKDITLGLMQWK